MILKESEIKRILVVNLGSIGEVILSIPVTRALKENYPMAALTMLVTPAVLDIVAMNPYADAANVYDKHGEHQGASGLLGVVSMLRKGSFDLAVCMDSSPRGAVVAWAAGIRYRLGYDRGLAKIFLTHVAAFASKRVQHQAIQRLQILQPLAITTEDTSPLLVVEDKTEKIINTTLNIAADRPNVVFCPLHGVHPKRNPSPPKAVEIIRALEELANVYLIGGLAEKEALLELAAAAQLKQERVLAGQLNLKELAVFLRHIKVVVSVEAGTMYIAQAVKIPIVALFGPTDPLIYGPYGNRDVVLTHKMNCMPCAAQAKCLKNSCIEEIPVAEIVLKVKERLDDPTTSNRTGREIKQ